MQSGGAQNYHFKGIAQPSFISTVLGALALSSPVAGESPRLHDPAKPLSVQGFMLDHDVCLWFAKEKYQIKLDTLSETNCGEIAPWSLAKMNMDFIVSRDLLDHNQIQCSPEVLSQDSIKQLEEKLACLDMWIDEDRFTKKLDSERELAWVGFISSLPFNIIKAVALSELQSAILRPQMPMHEIRRWGIASLAVSTSVNIASNMLGVYMCSGSKYAVAEPSIKNSLVGSLLLALAVGGLSSALLPAPGGPEPRLRAQNAIDIIMGLTAFTVLTQAQFSHFLGNQILDGNYSNAAADIDVNYFGSLLGMFALALPYAVYRDHLARQHNQANPQPAVPVLRNPAPLPIELRNNARLAQINPSVHTGRNLSLAREQLVKLKRLDQSLPRRFKESDETIWARINVSVSLTDVKHSVRADGCHGTSYYTKSSANHFLQTLDSVKFIFDREFVDLRVTPREVVARIWRVAAAKAMAHDPTNEDLREKVAQDLLEQCARIATTIHGSDAAATNPCGSGKIESLLQFAQTLIPELDLFRGRWDIPPQSTAVKNECFAGFARDIEVLRRRGSTGRHQLSDGATKDYLHDMYVIHHNKMSSKVFEHMYSEFQKVLGV